VRGEERGRVVQDDDPPRLERAQHPHAVVDPVERRQDVQPPERGVTRAKLGERLLRRHRLQAEAVDEHPGEELVRRRGALSDEREAHRMTNRTDRDRPQGRSPARHTVVTG